jgi:hypothetical protein
MADARTDRIDGAVAKASELIGLLMQEGQVTPRQARVIIEAAVRAAVGNAEGWEVRHSAQRVAADLEGGGDGDRQAG